ncbi:MAG TPA: polysaccharide deacetylase family protein [Gemmatimonadales bacterium]|nr:polysaccharide deacetylase family protein [Gemmatimonadales bacterium]
MRSTLKSIVERALIGGGVSGLARSRLTGRGLVLAYHNILPEGAEPGLDTSLHLPHAAFVRQLEHLRRHHEVVPLKQLLDPRSGPSERPRVAITFDDAYQGAVTLGVATLARFRFPATIFAAPGILGGQGFWWDRVCRPDGSALSTQERQAALTAARGEDPQVLAWARTAGLAVREAVPAARSATEGELRSALAREGLTLASHTWSHPNLSKLHGDRLRAELTRSRAWIQEFAVHPLPYISYPYGLASADVVRAAEAAGYAAGFLVSGGWHRPGVGDPYRIPRLNVPAGISEAGFALRAAGLFCR